MKADNRFLQQSMSFWADVRIIGKEIGYSNRGENTVRIPTMDEILAAYNKLGLGTEHLLVRETPTISGLLLLDYLKHRADVLNNHVEPRLMNVERAKAEFERLRSRLNPKCPLPQNKQRGEKRTHAYLTGIINMLVEAHIQGNSCDFDPQSPIILTRNNAPLRTFARRVDGAFPSAVNPIAFWEIKEYYHTTTFGSRVADAVYETLLDGVETQEVTHNEGIALRHYLMVDSHYTWWKLGRSYLCRIFDTMHMGYLDEVLFGYEVIERLPELVGEWVSDLSSRG